ncbi:MAG TPA: glycosyltransferase family 2 protein [Kiritimatiellia bacterium]|nr:glycosyltransferase family 2 protein [Kiritimatiellia bacterium]HMP34327.1 glycosyltransferase family 2 protein [Kiritimatiellia bacterium]
MKRVVAILCVRDEAMMLRHSLAHLHREGIDFHIMNDNSNDESIAIAESFAGRGLVGISSLPPSPFFDLGRCLAYKEEVSRTLDADWFMHADADEFRTSNRPGERLIDAITRIDREGFNTVNFQEFTFIPTLDDPDHHPDRFLDTMRGYYPFLPAPLHRLNTWKNRGEPVDLSSDAGHRIRMPGLHIYPESLPLRHYLYISRKHFASKYAGRRHRTDELDKAWHGWRESADENLFYAAPAALLRRFNPLEPWRMDARDPLRRHLVETRP